VKFRGYIKIPWKRADSTTQLKMSWPGKLWALLITVTYDWQWTVSCLSHVHRCVYILDIQIDILRHFYLMWHMDSWTWEQLWSYGMSMS